METKSLGIGLVIGLLIAGAIGYKIFSSIDNGSYQSQIQSLEEDIKDYENQITEIESEIGTYQDTIEQKTQEIESLSAEVDELEKEITDLYTEITAIQEIVFIETSFSRTENTAADLIDWINQANESIKAMVMLITNDQITQSLIEAKNRAVTVEFIIDSEWLYSSGSDYTSLLDAGIDIRSDERTGLMHHKVMIIDEKIIITGSYNWSASAEDSNDENILILRSSSIASDYLDEFQRIWAQTQPHTPEPEPEPEPPSGEKNIVINEVEANPLGTDTGNEWVELYNPHEYAVDVGGWKITTTHGDTVTVYIPIGTTLSSHSCMVFSYTDQWIDNEDEQLILYDSEYMEKDRTPVIYDTSNDSRTWQRSPNGHDSDSSLDWVFRTNTKGSEN